MKFKEAWTVLRRHGWTSAPARGALEDGFYYLKPNVDLNSASRGDDFFPDPDALAEYINSSPKMRKIYGLTRVEIKTKEKPLSRRRGRGNDPPVLPAKKPKNTAAPVAAPAAPVTQSECLESSSHSSSEKAPAAKQDKFYCVVCKETDSGATRQCHRCKSNMHHFCSHAVAERVGKTDFGNQVFCSVECYDPTRGGDHDGEPEVKEKECTAPPEPPAKRPRNSAIVEDSSSSSEEEGDAPEYEVEEVRGKKVEEGITKYLMKWKDHDECTWEPEHQLNCPERIAEYEKRAKQANTKTKRLKPSSHSTSEKAPAPVAAPAAPVTQSGAKTMKSKRSESSSHSTSGKAPAATKFYCAVCDDYDSGATHQCDRCKANMHHYCSHVVAGRVGKKDFGTKSFCSLKCYDPSREGDHVGEPDDAGEPDVTDCVAPSSSLDTREVEWIEDKKYQGKNTQYLVKWRGEEEMTWEPIKDLEKFKVETSQYEFRLKQYGKKKATKKTSNADAISCRVCGDDQGAPEQQCIVCNVYMHQRCSDLVASQVGLSDFEDECFCSSECFDLYMPAQLVAFSPSKEDWGYIIKKKKGGGETRQPKYEHVGDKYLVGRICRRAKKKAKEEVRYEVRWLVTVYNNKVEYLDTATLMRGRKNFMLLDNGDDEEEDGNDEEEEEEDENEEMSKYTRYEHMEDTPESLEEVEKVESMSFDPSVTMEAPDDLFKREDGSSNTRVKDKYKEVFAKSATSSFLAYLPMSFWEEVVANTNAYQRDLGGSYGGYGAQAPFTIDDMMVFLGILFYMKLYDRGEYRNYWGAQEENEVLGVGSNASLDSKMPLKRYKALRASLCFTHGVSTDQLGLDPVAKIRNLVNILKKTGPRYVDVGRNIAIDECTISCRTRYARRLICFNPRKPGGKFHFKIYMACCAESWIALNYKVYTKDSQAEYRLGGVIPAEEILSFKDEVQNCSVTRADVMEVLRPYFHTKRIINTDNYYTSMLLLEGMRLKGLYGRGTVKSGSKHFPKHVMLIQSDKQPRGTCRLGVSAENKALAASWWDGNPVTMISNADSSEFSTVKRSVKMSKQEFRAPICIKEYNKYMQGVDRLDQLMKRWSVAYGHSFRKWHKKMAMAFIDIARCNAYSTRKLVLEKSKSRDPHRKFMRDLTFELLNGKWKELIPDESIYTDEVPSVTLFSPRGESRSAVKPETVNPKCKFISSAQWHEESKKEKSRKVRECSVCRYEGVKYPSRKTLYCQDHKVCLCVHVRSTPAAQEDWLCPNQEWVCWKKFHEFYLPNRLFNELGNIRKSSELYQKKLMASKPVSTPRDEFSQLLQGWTPESRVSTDYPGLTPRESIGDVSPLRSTEDVEEASNLNESDQEIELREQLEVSTKALEDFETEAAKNREIQETESDSERRSAIRELSVHYPL